jgi:hypothetical protein
LPEPLNLSVFSQFTRGATILAAFALGFASNGLAQKDPKAEHKVMVSVKPDYEDYLKRAQIGGVVRLKATVGADGKVGFVDILGRNPISGGERGCGAVEMKVCACHSADH